MAQDSVFESESGSWNVCCIISLPGLNVIHQDVNILVVVLRQDTVTIHQVSLQLRVLDIKHISIELLQVSIGHAWGVQLKIVTEHDLKFFCADMTAPVHYLFPVGHHVRWLRAVGVAMLSEDFRHLKAWVFNLVVLCIWVRVVVPFWQLRVLEIDLDLRALGLKLVSALGGKLRESTL